MREFLWHTNENGNDVHWVNWDELCCPKQAGVLGTKPICGMNEAFRTKCSGGLQRRMMLCGKMYSRQSMGFGLVE